VVAAEVPVTVIERSSTTVIERSDPVFFRSNSAAAIQVPGIPRGGGRYHVGRPYQIAGEWYTPEHDTGYDRVGRASWYGPGFHGRLTANGEVFDANAISAAHPTLPLPSYVRVTNLENDRSIIVRVNDRGPFRYKRLIDVSQRTAELLGFKRKGKADVRVQYIEQARLDGNDEAFLLASYRGPGADVWEGAQVRVASADAPARAARHLVRRNPVQVASYHPPAAETAGEGHATSVAFASTSVGARPAKGAFQAVSAPLSADDRILTAFEMASQTDD
jgi:rare lipoprotein A